MNHFKRWDELPAFELYSDQIVTIVNDELSNLDPYFKKNTLTKTMINNYVKHNILPKPIKKRYFKDHIAYLLAITLLKPVLTIDELSQGISTIIERMGVEKSYNLFCDIVEKTNHHVYTLFDKSNNDLYFNNQNREYKILYLVTLSLWTKLYGKAILQEVKNDNE